MAATSHPLLGLNAALSSSCLMGCGPVSGPSSLKHNTYRVPSCSVTDARLATYPGRSSPSNVWNSPQSNTVSNLRPNRSSWKARRRAAALDVRNKSRQADNFLLCRPGAPVTKQEGDARAPPSRNGSLWAKQYWVAPLSLRTLVVDPASGLTLPIIPAIGEWVISLSIYRHDLSSDEPRSGSFDRSHRPCAINIYRQRNTYCRA